MGLLDIFRKKKQNNTLSTASDAVDVNISSVNDFGGSRITIPSFAQGGMVFGTLPKRAKRELGLDDRRLNMLRIEDLMNILVDAHPDMSFAVWNFVRIANSGYSIKVTKLGSDSNYAQGEKLIKRFIQRLELPNTERFETSRSLDKVINQLFLSTVLRGAAAAELVLTQGLKEAAFIGTVDPGTVTFQLEQDRFIPYQNEGKLRLDIPTFFYEGLDERIDDPHGRSPLIAAINMIMFQMQVLNDIKAVVHNQGYPRFDISVLEEVLLSRMPISIRSNEEKKQEWLNSKLSDIINIYNQLEPDATFVHYDSIKIDMVGGGKGGGAMIDPEKLMNCIDNLIMAGLKTVSTVLGRRSTGNTESFAKMEIKLYLKGVEAIQDTVERVLSRLFTLYLNIKGKQGIVYFRFKPIEIRTELEKAQFEQIYLRNLVFMREQGWIDNDEASIRAVGHRAIAEPLIEPQVTEDIQGSRDEKGTDSPTETPE